MALSSLHFIAPSKEIQRRIKLGRDAIWLFFEEDSLASVWSMTCKVFKSGSELDGDSYNGWCSLGYWPRLEFAGHCWYGEKRLCEGEGLWAESERGGILGQVAGKVAFKVNFTGFLKGGAVSQHFSKITSRKHRAKAVFNLVPFIGLNIVQK